MMDQHALTTYLLSLTPLSEEFISVLNRHMQQHVYKKGQPLKTSQRNSSIWFLVNGIIKSCYFDSDGNEHVSRFWKEGEIILLEENAYHEIPSADYLIMIENTVLLSIPDLRVAYLLAHFHQAQTLRSMIFQMDRDKAEVHSHLLRLPIKAAYRKFEKIFPVNRIPIQDIARYLGVPPKRISEIRSGKQ
ncbi:Crp/Fnr family transcriptional regulator [Dyadobacter frigoris]|uniref:Crp/Fnr family transcriptional regulator n=1 Tax=Dyadobacter frigoris TaxID=2576211 RepID=A0A4U6CMD7_9BACT|nr:Crp/Fnr family transcriptional regulator [Dyadobacter frigoris]TKT85490.1 Crp/Fnr family transcriptional regulator [Dyadobacter frigoris]GLU56233.1 cyclic nucleotide-binding protein [Dyadobacter frigoris]